MLELFSPKHLTEDAKISGFFQCREGGLVWFGRDDLENCPQGPHGKTVRVALLCRDCDAVVPLAGIVAHLSGPMHTICSENSK